MYHNVKLLVLYTSEHGTFCLRKIPSVLNGIYSKNRNRSSQSNIFFANYFNINLVICFFCVPLA